MPRALVLPTSVPSRGRPVALAAGVVAAVVVTAVTLTTTPGPGRVGWGLPSRAAGAALVYALPVDDVVVRRFERPAHRWSPGHRGVDIDAAVGTPVLAPGDGVVTFGDVVVDRGVLTIRHPDGLRSSLEPLEEMPAVGTEVRAGDVVGAVADDGTHCAPDDCLHWGVRRGEDYLDPLDLLPGASPVVLLATARVSSGRSPGGWTAAGAWPPCASVRGVTR